MTTFATPQPITATLTTAGARIRVTATDRPDTVVRVAPVDPANKADAKVAERTEVAFADGELSVKTTKSGEKRGSVAITVELPAGSRLVLNTAWTDVRTEGPLGDCLLNVASGDVHLGHVTGHATIEGGSAAVRLGHAQATVEFNSAGGSFDVDRADGDVVARAGACPIRIGRLTRGEARLANASGGIDVGVAEGSAARVDAGSTKGQVRNSLPEEPAAEVRIHARTRRDDIVIHRAAA
ncbi:hypothetical protein [Amycolatopsis vancoresmycina]|uniref:Adhesin domain-containing protein n=1 Tax=Amycolatopsis vancoresmycina DSM 44592 TaxID=1292037 RepID=R1FVF9_9PSEU|nr:hypothetical protein [Amycolatopsis vancoresmycina]EOD63377.1 hypothetical protein H480_37345 [Amycolatopsis vancoresmycina DSM 44592]